MYMPLPPGSGGRGIYTGSHSITLTNTKPLVQSVNYTRVNHTFLIVIFQKYTVSQKVTHQQLAQDPMPAACWSKLQRKVMPGQSNMYSPQHRLIQTQRPGTSSAVPFIWHVVMVNELLWNSSFRFADLEI